MSWKAYLNLWITTFISWIAFFFVYCFNLENSFQVNLIISNFRLNFAIPVLFFSILFIYILSYAKLARVRILDAFFLILPLALFWKLSYFLCGLFGADPWSGNKAVFTLHSHIYLTIILSVCIVIFYRLRIRFAASKHQPLILIPGAFFILFLLYRIFNANAYIYLLSISLTSLLFFHIWQRRQIFVSLNSRKIYFVLFIFFLAFGVRMAWGVRVISITSNQFYAASDDGDTYGPNSERWAKGTGGPSAFGTYGGYVYSIFLGLIYKFFGNPNYYAAVFFQSILGALIPVCVYYIAQLISSTAVARGSATIVALSMNSIFTSTVIGMEALYLPLIYIFLCLVIKCIYSGKIRLIKYSLLIGILLGLANIVRPETLMFPAFLILSLFIFNKKRLAKKDIIRSSVTIIIGLAVVIALFCLRNYYKEGRFDFKTNSAAISFCLVENNISESKTLCEMGFNPFEDATGALKVFTMYPGEVSVLLAKNITKKGFNYLFCPNFGEMDLLTMLNNAGISSSYNFLLYLQFYIYLFVIAGIILMFKDKKCLLEKSIIGSFIGYMILFYAVIYAKNARYRAVLDPLFSIYFVYTTYYLINKFRKTAI